MMIWRKIHRLFFFAIILMAAAAMLLWKSASRRSADAWAQWKQELAVQGEVIQWEAFLPAPVPDEENFFAAPEMELWFSRKHANARPAIFHLPAWENPVTLEQLRAAPEGDLALLRQWAETTSATRQLLVAAAQRPAVRFNADFTSPSQMDLPNFVHLRQVAQAVFTHAHLSLLDGNINLALEDLLILRRLADLSGNSPMLVSGMVQMAIMELYAETARAAIESDLCSDAHLAAIQSHIDDLNLIQVFTRSIRAERAALIHLMELPAPEFEKELELLQKAALNPPEELSLAFWRVDWAQWFKDYRLRSKLRSRNWLLARLPDVLRVHQPALEQFPLNQRVHAAALKRIFDQFQVTLKRPSSEADLAVLVMPGYVRAALTSVRNQTKLNQLLAACALERHRLRKGYYPGELESLIPAFLDRIPGDLFTEGPLQYRRNPEGGYKLWSLGWDEQDNGGAFAQDENGPGQYDEQPGDWVWESSRR